MTYIQTAQDIFRTAYDNRYTWDENFPGYTGDIKLTQGEEVYTGKIKVNPDFTTEVTGIEDKKVTESIIYQLRDIVTHRKRNSFEKVHGKNNFSLGEKDHTSAVEIFVNGEAMGSKYKVRGKEICQVYRVMGAMAFYINTQSTFQTEEGYLPLIYDAIFLDAKTQEEKGKKTFEEHYEKIGNYYLPTHQIIESIDANGEGIKTIFEFFNFEFLTS
jgi:hypothetical protein